MRPGKASYDLPAAEIVGDNQRFKEQITYAIPLEGGLSPGEQVLAISVHNTENPSSDLRIGGIRLVAVDGTPR